jgi:hypothetical protein
MSIKDSLLGKSLVVGGCPASFRQWTNTNRCLRQHSSGQWSWNLRRQVAVPMTVALAKHLLGNVFNVIVANGKVLDHVAEIQQLHLTV